MPVTPYSSFPRQLTVHRHDRNQQASITLSGEIDLESAPLVRESLRDCLYDGIRAVDVDLTAVTFCDCSGLNVFLDAAQRTTAAGASLRLRHPSPIVARLLATTGTGFLLAGLPFGGQRPAGPGGVAGPVPAAATSGVR